MESCQLHLIIEKSLLVCCLRFARLVNFRLTNRGILKLSIFRVALVHKAGVAFFFDLKRVEIMPASKLQTLRCNRFDILKMLVSMLNHVDPAEIGTFKAAVEAQFGTDAIAFLEPAIPTPAETIEPEPIAPIAPEPAVMPEVAPVIDIEAAPAIDEPIGSIAKSATLGIESSLNKMTIQDIRKLATAKKVSGNGTRAVIAGRLKAIVTQVDIWDATA